MFAEINDRQARICNIILFNLPESPNALSNLVDNQSISNLFRKIDVNIDPILVVHLGKLSNKHRPI